MAVRRPPQPSLQFLGLALSLGLGLIGATESQAALSRYEYGGVITQADPSTGVAVGTRFTGTFAYDPINPPRNVNLIPEVATYLYGLAAGTGASPDASGLTAQVGGQSIYNQPGGLQVQPSHYSYAVDTTAAKTMVEVASGDYRDNTQINARLRFANTEQAVYPGYAPPLALNLTDFNSARFLIQQVQGTTATVLYAGTIDTLTQVPEPATWLFLAAGVGTYLIRHRPSRRPGSRRTV